MRPPAKRRKNRMPGGETAGIATRFNEAACKEAEKLPEEAPAVVDQPASMRPPAKRRKNGRMRRSSTVCSTCFNEAACKEAEKPQPTTFASQRPLALQ